MSSQNGYVTFGQLLDSLKKYFAAQELYEVAERGKLRNPEHRTGTERANAMTAWEEAKDNLNLYIDQRIEMKLARNGLLKEESSEEL